MSTLEALEELKGRLSTLKDDLNKICDGQKNSGWQSEGFSTPQIEDVAEAAAAAIRKVMGKGSTKSAYGEWFHRDSLRYNSDRVISHTIRVMQQVEGSVGSPDGKGETERDLAERALCRAAFVLFKLQEGQTK